jgi:hypothetical protein
VSTASASAAASAYGASPAASHSFAFAASGRARGASQAAIQPVTHWVTASSRRPDQHGAWVSFSEGAGVTSLATTMAASPGGSQTKVRYVRSGKLSTGEANASGEHARAMLEDSDLEADDTYVSPAPPSHGLPPLPSRLHFQVGVLGTLASSVLTAWVVSTYAKRLQVTLTVCHQTYRQTRGGNDVGVTGLRWARVRWMVAHTKPVRQGPPRGAQRAMATSHAGKGRHTLT